MAAELKIVVTGEEAAMAKINAMAKAYDDLTKKAIDGAKKASKARLAIVADEVQKSRNLYKSVSPSLSGGRAVVDALPQAAACPKAALALLYPGA